MTPLIHDNPTPAHARTPAPSPLSPAGQVFGAGPCPIRGPSPLLCPARTPATPYPLRALPLTRLGNRGRRGRSSALGEDLYRRVLQVTMGPCRASRFRVRWAPLIPPLFISSSSSLPLPLPLPLFSQGHELDFGGLLAAGGRRQQHPALSDGSMTHAAWWVLCPSLLGLPWRADLLGATRRPFLLAMHVHPQPWRSGFG